jgi:hypothetical protein
MTNRSIKVDYISRLEGEAALDVNLVDGTIDSLKLKIICPEPDYPKSCFTCLHAGRSRLSRL